jgi:uncharacterized protein (DUF2141 family)
LSIDLEAISFESESPLKAIRLDTSIWEWQIYTSALNKQLLEKALNMMQIKANLELASTHQMMPNTPRTDSLYLNYYCTLSLKCDLSNQKGDVYVTLTSGEKNFNRRQGTAMAKLPVKGDSTFVKLYAIPKGEYAVAGYHDLNSNRRLDTGRWGLPAEPYAFSGKRRIFGLPSSYDRAVFELETDRLLHLRF